MRQNNFASQGGIAPLTRQLADKDTALHNYFDVLLESVTESDSFTVDSDINEQIESQIPITVKQDKSLFISEDDVSSPGESSSSKERLQMSDDEPVAPENTLNEQAPCTPVRGVEPGSNEFLLDDALADDSEDYYVEGAPDWARRPFEVLEFTIAKLRLAIPLTHLCGILDWQFAELTPMPGYSKHFIGVWPNNGTNSKIVDVSNILVPQRYQHKIESWQTRVTKVVLIDDSAWGLVCDEILEVVTLDPREVCWRSDRTQRAWLAGTLVGQMSAIIDGDEFATTLLQGAPLKGVLETILGEQNEESENSTASSCVPCT